jgi:phosphatidylinositol-3,4,5-trisphosphate 3-phosphatase/dual-specificity protein phosphatase PTEN
MVFALPGEPGLTELSGDFKIHFHDRQGDFYCWLNTTMMENRVILKTSELDGFEKRKLPSPGFMVEVVLADINQTIPASTTSEASPEETSSANASPVEGVTPVPGTNKEAENADKDDVFSDNESDSTGPTKTTASASSQAPEAKKSVDETTGLAHATEKVSISGNKGPSSQSVSKAEATEKPAGSGVNVSSSESSEFKVMAADASVFSFGDEDDFESD